MAKGPGGKEVGRVTIRVAPDTSDFKKELETKLKEIEKELELKVPVKFDTSQASAAAAKLKKQWSNLGSELNLSNGIGDMNLQLGRTAGLVNKTLNSWKSVSALTKKVSADLKNAAAATASFAKKAVDVSGAISKISSAGKSIKDAFNAPEVAKSGNVIEEVVASMIRDVRGFGNVAKLGFRTFSRTATSSFKAVGRESVKAGKLLTRGVVGGIQGAAKSALGLGKLLLKPFQLATQGIGALGSGISSAASGLSSMGRGGLLLVGVLAIIAPLVGIISAAVAALPSILAAAGAGFAAIALGMDGIKAAAKTLDPQITALKTSLSATFQQGLTPIFNQLKTVFPVLQTGLNQVAQGLIPMAQAFTSVVTSASGLQMISTILANTGKFFTALQPTITTFTGSFLQLAAVGSQSFGTLAGVLNTFGTQWAAMVSTLAGNGTLTGALNALYQVLGAVLNGFTQLVGSGLGAMIQLGGPLTTLINSFVQAFVAFMPILTTVSSLLAGVLVAALNALVPIFNTLAPVIDVIGQVLGQVLVGAIQALSPILNAVAQVLQQVFLVAFQALQPILPPLVKFFTQLGNILGTGIVTALTAITPLLGLAAQLLSSVFTAITPLLPQIAQLAQLFVTGLLGALTPLIPPITSIVQSLMPGLVQIITALVPIIGLIISAFTQVLPPIMGLVNGIASVAIPIINLLASVIKAVFPAIQQIISGVMKVIKGIIDVVMGLISGDWSRVWKGIKEVLGGIWDAIKGVVKLAINAIVSFFKGLPDALYGVLKGLWNGIKSIGGDLLRGLWNGITDAASWLWGKIKELGSTILGWVKGIFGIHSPSRVMRDQVGVYLSQGIAVGIQKGASAVNDAATSMRDGVLGVLSNNNVALAAGRDLGAQWSSGIQDTAPAALDVLDQMANISGPKVTGDFTQTIQSDGFGGMDDKIEAALSGWRLQMDPTGVLKLAKQGERKNRNR